ncbi:hypothetical protein [Actinospica acidithermotolerans]
MLAEGQRRRARGTDVVIGLVEPHGRPLTAAMAEGLEAVPRRQVSHRGVVFEDLDVAAVLARAPQVALVDELAHPNLDGSGHPKRWQDVDDLLAAGIDVVTTLNIQHLESLGEVVSQIIGVPQRETIPDAVVRRADQIELVDMTAEALRRRMVHGNIYPPDRIDAALTHYFRPGNLTALRELALLWMADRTEEGLRAYRAAHDIVAPWETRERVVVGLAGRVEEEPLVRRAARIAERMPGAELLAVHVRAQDGLSEADQEALGKLFALVESLGGSVHRVTGDDTAEALVQFARAHQATQLVLGYTASTHRFPLRTRLTTRVLRRNEGIDVNLVNDRGGGSGPERRLPRAARRRAVLAEAELIRALSVSVLDGHEDLPSLLEQVRRSCDLRAVSLLEPLPEHPGEWSVVGSAGEHAPETPAGADATATPDGSVTLAARGRITDPAVREAFAGAAERIRSMRVHAAERGARREERRHSVRATLATVQLVLVHELAPRLHTVRADLTSGEPAEIKNAAHTLDALTRRVEELIDLCRVDTGGLELQLRPVELDEVVEAALEDLGPGGRGLVIDLPEDLPDAVADADSLSRALTVLAADALRRSDSDRPPVLSGRSSDGRVQLDLTVRQSARQGPEPGADEDGTPRTALAQEHDLAVRLARGLIDAMAGTLDLKRTDGADRYSAVIDLPAARRG